MKIEFLEFIEGARKAKGIAVIIDVFRAFTVGCYAFDAGALRIIATASIENAVKLRNNYKNSILVGERKERKIEGFDFGNSPTEIIKANLDGKTVIHTTTAGTQGLISAVNADLVIAGSFVNSGAIVRYIKTIDPELVSIVAMGYRARQRAEEDVLCAELIAEGLLNTDKVSETKIPDLQYTSGKRFFNPENVSFSPPTDFFLCTMVNRFDFVLKAETRFDGNADLTRIDI